MGTMCGGCRFQSCKSKLERLLRRSRDGIKYVEHLEADGDEVFEAACMLGLEGIVCKRRTASYKSGSCKSWIKVRNRSRQRTCGSLTELSKELSPLP
jgi:bifunctional non-homologous end joining protein LigD